MMEVSLFWDDRLFKSVKGLPKAISKNICVKPQMNHADVLEEAGQNFKSKDFPHGVMGNFCSSSGRDPPLLYAGGVPEIPVPSSHTLQAHSQIAT